MVGDRVGWQYRSAGEYRRSFHAAGLTQCAPHCFTDRGRLVSPLSFDLPPKA